MVQAPSRTQLIADFEAHYASSREMFDRAQKSIAGGIAHDGRHQKPFPIYVSRADGAYKYDVEDRRLIDFAMGHGALILGHGDPDVRAAMHAQVDKGTHFGSGHEGEIAWAEQIRRMIPSAERVRFVASGTEANLLAMRLARSYTGKNTILKFEGHFHGWSDYVIKSEKPPFESPKVAGVPDEVLRTVAAVPANNIEMLTERLSQGDVAAILVEPSGASWGQIPLDADFLTRLREVATQVRRGPDLRRGDHRLPLVARRRAAAVRHHARHDHDGQDRGRRHAGRRGGRPGRDHGLPRVQGRAGLGQAQGHPPRHLQRQPADGSSRARLSPEVRRSGRPGALRPFGLALAQWHQRPARQARIARLCVGRQLGLPHHPRRDAKESEAGDLAQPIGINPETLKSSAKAGRSGPLSLAMQLEGVDLFGGGGMLSVRHTDEDIAYTIEAFDNALNRLERDGYFA